MPCASVGPLPCPASNSRPAESGQAGEKHHIGCLCGIAVSFLFCIGCPAIPGDLEYPPLRLLSPGSSGGVSPSRRPSARVPFLGRWAARFLCISASLQLRFQIAGKWRVDIVVGHWTACCRPTLRLRLPTACLRCLRCLSQSSPRLAFLFPPAPSAHFVQPHLLILWLINDADAQLRRSTPGPRDSDEVFSLSIGH